jgi:hypothetical protein
MHHQARGLVEDQKAFVLVKNVEGDRLRPRLGRLGRGDGDTDLLASPKLRRRARDAPLNHDQAFGEQAFYAGP